MFWKKKDQQNKSNKDNIINDSIDAMIAEATRQGWLPDRDLGMIPELVDIYKNAANHFSNMIFETEPEYRETLMYHTCKYLFAKAVEGVILWGMTSDGQISVYFHPKHLTEGIETEVPFHLHQIVIDSMSIGDSLFRAHQEFVIQSLEKGVEISVDEEIAKTIQWISSFGIGFALFNNYQALR